MKTITQTNLDYLTSDIYKATQCPFLPEKDPALIRDAKPAMLHSSRAMRMLFFSAGVLFFMLGMVGVVVPGMPTTVFILLAAYCWMRSSVRFYAWIMRHRDFGKMVRDWQTRRAMPRFAKYLAWGMMTASTLFLAFVVGSMWAAGVMAVVTVVVGSWMYRLTDA